MHALRNAVQNGGKERWAANLSGEGASHDFVGPRVLHGPGALNGGVEIPGKNKISIRMATRHVDSTGGGDGVVVMCE